MHKNWKDNILGLSIGDPGYSSIEIDESEIVGNQNVIYWIFGLIERSTKEARIYCVLNNRTERNLLKIVEDNITTDNLNDIDLNNINLMLSWKKDIFSNGLIIVFGLVMEISIPIPLRVYGHKLKD